ncbi:hypothetical protein AVEN_46397-1 [Araneus ventricosus]|uniref:Uncharacterized protein n=1 Tax=Araneus ventricosus TaxID=182803 RepID=A0A4Y2JLS2_ARAVE|nr:hypothetical protein AVEN_46397-1 [Araneus ventricosus]
MNSDNEFDSGYESEYDNKSDNDDEVVFISDNESDSDDEVVFISDNKSDSDDEVKKTSITEGTGCRQPGKKKAKEREFLVARPHILRWR